MDTNEDDVGLPELSVESSDKSLTPLDKASDPLDKASDPLDKVSDPSVEASDPLDKASPILIDAPEFSGSITLEFGDIIEIIAPTNPELDQVNAIIQYIDQSKIILVNVATAKRYQLNIENGGRFTDESITQIYLLDRAEEKGFARQNNLLPRTWVDIHFGGEVPTIITGEITNLEEDMIEVTTFPEFRTLYINFGYKGIPENIPIRKISIRNKPESLKSVTSLVLLKEKMDEEGDDFDMSKMQSPDEEASIEYTETGESIISIPEGREADKTVRENLREMYLDANRIIFGERLDEIRQMVEVAEGEQRYGIDVQVNDLMDELLSTIPLSHRTHIVMSNIHLLIERFKQLRTMFSKFDRNNNVYSDKTLGADYKPLVQHIKNMDYKLKWLIPVVSNRRKLYDVGVIIETPDIIPEKIGRALNDIKSIQQNDQNLSYNDVNRRIQEIMKPIDLPDNHRSCIINTKIMTELDAIVDNLEDFYSNTIVLENSESKITRDRRLEGISKQQFVIQRYGLGLTRLDENLLKSGKTVYTRTPMTPNDDICIKSLLMMPEPVVKFSSIDLPTTNILVKSTLHHSMFLLYKLFNQNIEKHIIPHVIDDLTKQFDYDKMDKDSEHSLFEGIHQFMIDNDTNLDYEGDDSKTDKFLDTVVPKTRYLIKLVQKYITDKVSHVDIVQQLEPFMIYPSDISYKQYLEIRFFIKNKIIDIKKKLQFKANDFSVIRNFKYNVSPKMTPILRILSENADFGGFADNFFASYKFLNKSKLQTALSSQEILSKMNTLDNSSLFCNTMTTMLISLMTPNNLVDALASPNIDDIGDFEQIRPTDCTRRFLAKKYKSVKQLQKDNDVENLFYDKDLDDTPYSIMKKYEKERKQMLPELFTDFLELSLKNKHDCPADIAPTLTQILIEGKKRVTDGDYAILEIRPTLSKESDSKLSDSEQLSIDSEAEIRKKVQYFRRSHNNWVHDDTIDDETFIDNNTLFCNISSSCFKNTNNGVCEDTNSSSARHSANNRKKMFDEFDKRYEVSVEELEDELKRNIAYHERAIIRNQHLVEIQLYKPNNLAYAIGGLAEVNDLIKSPYTKLLNLIMGQDDFVKKQSDLVKFRDAFCRDPMIDQLDDDPHWLYCKETNTKLLPLSLYDLARAYTQGLNYTKVLQELCVKVGELSDDGDAIVDKYSGYVLRKIDLTNEEGFDDAGFKITTHDIMEQDLGTVIMEAIGKKEKPVFENDTIQMIYNIFSTITSNIGIPVETITEFVLRISNELIEKNVWSETIYAKKSADAEKKTGKPFKATFTNYRNESIINIVASSIIIAIQTATPSFQTKKTFPGCIRSFSGYPFEGGIEDLTAIKYMACVLNKTKSSIQPWTSIQKFKVDTLETRIKSIIEKQIMVRADINELYIKKRDFIALNPNTVAPFEHSIQKWRHFMPPVVDFSVVKSLRSISATFKSDFMEVLRNGHPDQRQMLNVVKSKIVRYGYGVIESINNIVSAKELLMKTMSGIPFLENACCNETELTNPMVYFNEEDDNIMAYLKTVQYLSTLVKDTKILSTASIIYHPNITSIKYPDVPIGYLEDDIYAAVIHYCNLDRVQPIPEELQFILSEKIPLYNPNWSLLEKIAFLKRNGKQFDIDQLSQLMQVVTLNNIVATPTPVQYTQVTILKDLIESIDATHSNVIEEPLRKLLSIHLDKYNPNVMSDTVSPELYNLKRHLSKSNDNMYKEIIAFFGRYSNLSDREYEKVHGFLTQINQWSPSVKDDVHNVVQFIQTMIYNISKVYPAVLVNNASFYKYIPKHWGLSDEHMMDIHRFVSKYYVSIEQFKGDRIIVNLLKDVAFKLVDLNTFIKNIPVQPDIIKEMIGEDGLPILKSFHGLFDKQAIQLIYSYCLYSAIYEYILSSDNSELLRADVEDLKTSRRADIASSANPSNLLVSADESVDEYDAGLNEVHIVTGNKTELKERVCSLLLTFLNVEYENKTKINVSYADIIKQTSRTKEKEKRGIIKKLGNMSIEERKVEDMMKNYRLGRWNVGQQKGLFKYDAKTYGRERSELIAEMQGEYATGNLDVVSDELLDVYELERLDDANADAEIDDETFDINDLGGNFTDGAYYEEDQETDD